MSALAKVAASARLFTGPGVARRSDRAREAIMQGIGCRTFISKACMAACTFFLCSGIMLAQNAAPAPDSSATDLTNVVRSLSETVRQLQTQVQSLNAELNEMRAREQGGAATDKPSAAASEAAASGGITPALPQWQQDFKSCVSTSSTTRASLKNKST